MRPAGPRVNVYLDRLRALDFVRDVEFTAVPLDGGVDGLLKIRTDKGRYTFAVEQKNSYLDRSLLNAFISQAKYYTDKQHKPMLLFARYVPRPSAERLIESGVSFVDQAGNMHLVLRTNFVRTIVGNREAQSSTDSKALTPAKVQLLFALAAYDQASEWTVRQLAEVSGVSKSNVAKLRKQLVEQGILKVTGRKIDFRNRSELEPLLLSGYEQALRPKLIINRFRAAESSLDTMLEKIGKTLDKLAIRWSLSGGPAAYELQRFYKGIEVPIFVDLLSNDVIRELRLLPDRSGPLVFLRAFGAIPYWKEVDGKTIAHPWLIYSELMHSSDPRAHEAAERLKAEFLKERKNDD